MNKAELAEALATKVGLSKQQGEQILEALTEIVTETLKSGDEVTITGFGAFSARRRAARQGINPQNPSEKITIPAVTVPKFRAGKNLKESLKENI